jgi:hypothetical protein
MGHGNHWEAVIKNVNDDLASVLDLGVTQGGITASEYASGAALAKFVYDGATFLYSYFGECQ